MVIVAMGSALLLGPMLAQAERVNLSGGTAEGLGPLAYAQETLPPTANTTTGRWALELEENFHVAVKPRRAINPTEEIYLRIDLSGAHFGNAPSLIQGSLRDATDPTAINVADLADTLDSDLSSGGAGQSFAVLKLGAAGAGATVAAANLIAVVIPSAAAAATGDLQLTSTSGSVTATIAAYTNPDDALDQVNSRSTFGGSGMIVRLVSGLSVTISPAPNPVASVDHGFVTFLNASPPPPVTGQVRLGWLGVEENIAATAGLRDADDGTALVANDVLAAGSQVEFTVTGDLDIGAFTIKEETFQMAGDPPMLVMMNGSPVPTGTCDGVAEGSVDQGTLKGADGMALIGEEGEMPSGVTSASSGNLDPDVYLLCLNVDVTGPGTNMNPIPEGDYSAMASTKSGATSPAQMVGEGDLASIERNGASVDIPYLTTSEKHNQRLIIVNRGRSPVAITTITFTTEDGTDVELMDTVQAAMDAGLLAVPGMSSWVARMDETISITGDSRRVAASIAFAGTAGHLSVATTQVNVSDGSTDTVVYDVED